MVDIMHNGVNRMEFVRMAQNKADAGSDDLFSNVFGKDRMANFARAATESMSAGQIESMNIPDTWVKREPVNLKSGAGLVEYHPGDNNDVRLNSFYRGNRIGDDAAKAFKHCLNETPHHIAKGSEELKSLTEVLGDKANNFNIAKAFTDVLNGKKVLVVEGEYKNAEHTTSKTVYVDSDGTGSAVQELSYSAPGALYKAHLTEAEKSMKSIIWK